VKLKYNDEIIVEYINSIFNRNLKITDTLEYLSFDEDNLYLSYENINLTDDGFTIKILKYLTIDKKDFEIYYRNKKIRKIISNITNI
jgi:hypothetical protein